MQVEKGYLSGEALPGSKVATGTSTYEFERNKYGGVMVRSLADLVAFFNENGYMDYYNNNMAPKSSGESESSVPSTVVAPSYAYTDVLKEDNSAEKSSIEKYEPSNDFPSLMEEHEIPAYLQPLSVSECKPMDISERDDPIEVRDPIGDVCRLPIVRKPVHLDDGTLSKVIHSRYYTMFTTAKANQRSVMLDFDTFMRSQRAFLADLNPRGSRFISKVHMPIVPCIYPQRFLQLADHMSTNFHNRAFDSCGVYGGDIPHIELHSNKFLYYMSDRKMICQYNDGSFSAYAYFPALGKIDRRCCCGAPILPWLREEPSLNPVRWKFRGYAQYVRCANPSCGMFQIAIISFCEPQFNRIIMRVQFSNEAKDCQLAYNTALTHGIVAFQKQCMEISSCPLSICYVYKDEHGTYFSEIGRPPERVNDRWNNPYSWGSKALRSGNDFVHGRCFPLHLPRWLAGESRRVLVPYSLRLWEDGLLSATTCYSSNPMAAKVISDLAECRSLPPDYLNKINNRKQGIPYDFLNMDIYHFEVYLDHTASPRDLHLDFANKYRDGIADELHHVRPEYTRNLRGFSNQHCPYHFYCHRELVCMTLLRLILASEGVPATSTLSTYDLPTVRLRKCENRGECNCGPHSAFVNSNARDQVLFGV